MLPFIGKNQKYFAVLGGFLIHLSLGGFYTSGHIQQLIMKYMSNHSLSRDTIKPHDGFWIFGLIAFAQGSAISAGGYLASKIGSPLTVIFGGWLMSLNVCLTYLTIKTYFVVVVLTYSVFAGIGTGLCYAVALNSPCKRFIKHKGLVLGLVVSGYGLSPAFFDLLENYFVTKSIENLPWSFVALGSIYAFLQLIGAILLKENNDNQKIADSIDRSIQSYPTEFPALFPIRLESHDEPHNLKPYQLFFEFDFWILWLTFLMNTSTLILIISSYYNFGLFLNLSNSSFFGDMTVVSIVAAICNFSGRIFFGYLIDRKPYKVVMITLSLVTSILMGTLYLLKELTNYSETYFLYCIWIAALHFCISGNYSIFPSMVIKLFGMKNFVYNYGILFTACSVAGTVVSITTFCASDGNNFSGQSYLSLYISGCVLSFVSVLLTILFRGRSLMFLR